VNLPENSGAANWLPAYPRVAAANFDENDPHALFRLTRLFGFQRRSLRDPLAVLRIAKPQ
jgi:hypothetical protein